MHMLVSLEAEAVWTFFSVPPSSRGSKYSLSMAINEPARDTS